MSQAPLLRSFSTSLDTLRGTTLDPEVLIVHNSTLPFSLNDGALWAGRGWSTRLRAGVRARWGRFTLVLAPELVSAENRAFTMPDSAVQLARPAGRSPYSTPWHVGTYSLDMPLRFGATGFTRIDPGQSTLAAELGNVTVGVSTENEWWGPGIRNAIVLSDNAPGIWRGFVRWTSGTFSARWFLGGLFESRYFDSGPANNARAITALAATWTPTANLTFGAARAVYAPLAKWSDVFGHAFDVARGNGTRQRDQVFSLFGRWVFPADGFAVHAEWARNQLPGSLRELLVSPNHTQGYTLGLEWERGAFRTEAEVTYLEKSPAYRNLPEETWYTGAAATQGYTQRGQSIGAAIGPGAASQWLAGDYQAHLWRAGLFVGRIRWDNDALYLFPSSTDKRLSHDVTIFGGVRGQWRRVAGTLTLGRRLNPFYRTDTSAANTTLELRFAP